MTQYIGNVPEGAKYEVYDMSIRARSNVLFNSDFAINQRGYGGGALAYAAYGYDRWMSNVSNSTMNVSGIVATIDHTTASTDGEFQQRLEGGSLIEGETYTLSWEGTAQMSVYRANGSANNWTTSPIVFTAPSGVDGNSVQEYIKVKGDGVTLSKVKLERGSGATPWEKPDATIELIRCKRYYQTIYIGTYATLGVGRGQGTSATYTTPAMLPVRMRQSPSGNSSTTGDMQIKRISDNTTLSSTQNITIAAVDNQSYTYYCGYTHSNADETYRLNTTASAFTGTLDAEL